jgi:hypothetical protein
VRSLRSRVVCTRCGMIDADVRPDWGPHVNKTIEASETGRTVGCLSALRPSKLNAAVLAD